MSDQPRSFWDELKDRKVVRVAAMYAVVGWVVVEVADTVAPLLALPEWLPRVVLVMLILGFPIAVVLSWAFDVTPDGMKRAAPLGGASGHPSRLPFMAGIVVGISALSIVAFLMPGGAGSGSPGAPEALDANVVAVVPFGFVGPDDLDHMGEGVFYLLSARFTGEIGPRAVDPDAARAHWQEVTASGSVTTGEDVARRLGAGLVLTGSVVSDPAGLNINASLRNVTDGAEIAVASAQGPADSLATVVDRLAAGLLSLSTGEYSRSLEQLTSTSPEALREYLLGQREFRRGDFFAAVDHFRSAVDIDSTFALAALAWGDASNNVPGGTGDSYQRAWRHRDHLAERDRIYLSARLGPNYPDPATTPERIRAYEEALKLAPDRAAIWYFLGEATFHRPQSRAALEQSRRYFERAIELEPTHGLAINHLELIDHVRGDLADLTASIARQVAADTVASPAWAAIMLAQIAGDTVGFTAALATWAEPYRPAMSTWSPEFVHGPWVIEAREQLGAARMDEILPSRETFTEFQNGYEGLLDLGRPGAAEEVLSGWESATGLTAAPELRLANAIYSEVPEEIGLRAAAAVEASLAGEAPSERVRPSLMALEFWRLSRDDGSRTNQTIATLRAGARAVPRARALTYEMSALLLEAISQESRSDPGARETLDQMDELFRQTSALVGTTLYNMLLLEQAALYERLGDPNQALATLERESVFQFTDPFNMRFWSERGRLLALTGDAQGAIRAYRHYLNFRYDPEAEVEAEVEAVRQALAELGGV